MVQYPTSKAALAKPDFDTDNAAEHGFVDFFRKMPARIPGTVRIFDRKDYYSAHGEDALFVADVVYHTKTVLKYWKARMGREGDLPSCTLSKAVAINFLREALTSRQMRVEIYKPALAGNSKRENWEIDAAASPGNLEDVEELLFGDNIQISDAPMCLAVTFRIKEGIKTVGIAYADAVDRKIGLSEFAETDIWSNTESLLIQLGVKEVIYPADDKSNEIEGLKLRKLIDRCSIVHAERPKSSFGVKSIEQDLNGLIRGDVDLTARPEYDMKQALSACNGLITYLTLLTSDGNRNAYELKTHDLSHYMKLDASAVKALTLMPDPTSLTGAPVLTSGASSVIMGRAGKDSSSSLFGLLNKCQTGQGKRMLATWLKQPLVNLHQIENRQNVVEAFVEENDVRTTLRDDLLKLMPDFQRMAKRFQSKKATLDDIVRAYGALVELPNIVEQLEMIGTIGTGKDTKNKPLPRVVDNPERIALIDDLFLVKIRDDVANTEKFLEMVETTMDVAQFKNNKTIILPEYDDELRKLAKRIEKAKRALDDEFTETTEKLGFAANKTNPLHFENHSTYGHCFRLTRKESSAIKGKKEYIELANKSNGCTFTTRKMKEANEEYQSASELYGRKQSHLAKEIVDIANTYSNTLEGINPTIAQLDVICSLAHVAVNAPISYVKPKVLAKGAGSLILKESRHPCLETLPDVNFIPNDVEMEREKSEFQIITGANTGGKSVYLRQIGCIALMAQVGSFVPAAEAQIPIFDCILARVGAGDSQLKGISTFMAEMLETATILKSATKDSLIIIDELGRGTSTYDGFGLAWAISEHIAMQIRCFALFATHFHDLTTLSEQIPHVKNMHVMAHVEEKSDSITGRDIVMLYKVKPGISDQSFGIHVAELAKFPDEVVRLAKRKADELEEQLEDAEDMPHAQRPKCSAEEMAEGTALVAEMLKDWASQAEEDLPNIDEVIKACQSGPDGKQDEAATAARAEKELDLLREVFSKYQDRIQSNPYFANVLLETY